LARRVRLANDCHRGVQRVGAWSLVQFIDLYQLYLDVRYYVVYLLSMTTAEYALIVSIASIFISLIALLWNVWQKFLFVKPALQVSFGVWRIVQPGAPGHNRRLLHLSVTNMGPGPVILQACAGKRKKHCWRRAKFYGVLNPIHGDPADRNPVGVGPFGGDCPQKLTQER
jgi:hypothetical protein